MKYYTINYIIGEKLYMDSHNKHRDRLEDYKATNHYKGQDD